MDCTLQKTRYEQFVRPQSLRTSPCYNISCTQGSRGGAVPAHQILQVGDLPDQPLHVRDNVATTAKDWVLARILDWVGRGGRGSRVLNL